MHHINESHSFSERRKPSLTVRTADVILSLLRYLEHTDLGSNMILFHPSRTSVQSLSPVGKAEFSHEREKLSLKHSGFCDVRSFCWVLKCWLSQAFLASLVLEIFSFPQKWGVSWTSYHLTSSSTSTAK